jgi:hypothetical protein
MTATEALLAAEASDLAQSRRATRALIYLADGARGPPLAQGSIPGAEPPHPRGPPRSRLYVWSHRHTLIMCDRTFRPKV